MGFSQFAKGITGGFTPYNYQIKVADLLLAGKNVILSVPTGAGKTWASVLPFLYAKEIKANFPDKLIYSLPLRALTNSIYEDLKKPLSQIFIQTGEYSDDPNFEGDLILSTIDQTLSNFLCFPLALSPSQANVNAGSVMGSYLVFDEFHLLDERLSMATSMGMLRLLHNLSRFCIMTATLSTDLIQNIRKSLYNVEVVDLNDFPDDIPKIKSLIPAVGKKKVTVEVGTLNAEKIISEHKVRTMIICNRVERAQRLFIEIQGILKNKPDNAIELVCLHSRFFDKDRKPKEKKLKKLFGKGSTANVILIATQVVEAGMDISCQTLHTEISPVNSFLQRAGRCSRFENETGRIFVYDVLELNEREKITIEPESDEDKKEIKALNNKFLPYDKLLCEATQEALKSVSYLDGEEPERLVELVLKDSEVLIFKEMENRNFNLQNIREAWDDCTKNHYRRTIRDIQNVEVILISDDELPEAIKNPFGWETVGIFKWSLVAWLKRKAETVDLEADWLVKEALPAEDIFLDMGNSKLYTLRTLKDFSNLPTSVFLNAAHFGYSEDFGFNDFQEESFGNCSHLLEGKNKREKDHPLRRDTFRGHNLGLMGCFEIEFLPKIPFALREWASYLEASDLTPTVVERLIRLVILLHDYGKLNEPWQAPMQRYQAAKEGAGFDGAILAHTDFDKNNPEDVSLAKRTGINKRPRHAGAGAAELLRVIEAWLENEDLAAAACLAIARHHSSTNQNSEVYKIPVASRQEMVQLLREFGFADLEPRLKGAAERLPAIGMDEYRLFYLFLVRILRLCDQKATANLSNYLQK